MLLQPKTFKSKKFQKNRICKNFKNKIKLNFGSIGFFLLKPLQLTSNTIFKFKLFFKKSIKKSEKTKRKFWFFAFPHLPLSKKSTGTRMGKGKGRLDSWFTNINGGIILLEFKNLRYGRSLFFLKQFEKKIGIFIKIIFKSFFFLKLPIKNKIFKINTIF